jgi:hypothetical protein
MAGRIQKNLEIVLLGLEIPSLRGKNHSTHILQSTLIWPRCGIAQKNCEKQLELEGGKLDLKNAGWCRQILFKEVVESLFGLEMKLTASLSQSELASFGRFIAGRVLDIGADEVEDRIPGGELASLPLVYFSKSLLKSKPPEVIVSGFLDLSAEQFLEGQILELELPLLSQRDLVRQQRIGGNRGQVKYTRKKLLDKGEPDGIARIACRVLETK